MSGAEQLIIDEQGARTAPVGPLASSVGWALDRGAGCFSTGRVVEGSLRWRDDHRARLMADALSVSPDMPGAMAVIAALERATDDALADLDGPRTLRWGLFLDDAHGWRWALTLEPERRRWCDPGRRFTFGAVEAEVAWDAKTLDRAEHRAIDARGGEADGAVVLRRGRLAEGTWFNLALVREGRWTIPERVFPGLTLQRLLDTLAAEEAPVTRADIDPDALASADALLALSAVAGVGMVGAVDTWKCGCRPAGAALVASLGSAL